MCVCVRVRVNVCVCVRLQEETGGELLTLCISAIHNAASQNYYES